MSTLKCILILSYKSSGSTALQALLSKLPGVNTVPYTSHVYNETLFWSKAASILGRPQYDMYNSQTPIARDAALASFNSFIGRNLAVPSRDSYTDSDIFDIWGQLSLACAPVFLEKSPQHLYQPAVIQLLEECVDYHKRSIRFLIIGLVRNPHAMLYSDFKRRGSDPAINEEVWRVSYENLLVAQRRGNLPLHIVRYEDIVTDLSTLDPVVEFAGHNRASLPVDLLHCNSVERWRMDGSYAFRLSTAVRAIAARFGYFDDELGRNA